MSKYKVTRNGSVLLAVPNKMVAQAEMAQMVIINVEFLRECGVAAEVHHHSHDNIKVTHCNGTLHYLVEV